MDKNREQTIQALQEAVERMPEEMQKAIIWAIGHYDIVEQLCKDSGMTNERIEEAKIEAKEKGDYFLLMLLCATQIFNDPDEAAKQQN